MATIASTKLPDLLERDVICLMRRLYFLHQFDRAFFLWSSMLGKYISQRDSLPTVLRFICRSKDLQGYRASCDFPPGLSSDSPVEKRPQQYDP